MSSCKRVLVTGGRGFIGRHMVAELKSRGHAVHGYDIVEGYDARALFRSEGTSMDPFPPRYFDLVCHAAYHVGGRVAIDDPSSMNFAKNLELDAAMFDWAVRAKVGHVLYFSSSAAYPVMYQKKLPSGSAIRLREDMIDLSRAETPDANYGWAKLTGERLAANARGAGLKVSVVRPMSGYGADQDLDYPFPSIIKRASQGDLSVWGGPGQCRDWIHVSDVVAGALAVVEKQAETSSTEPVNLCTGVATEMGELAQLAASMAGQRVTAVQYQPDKPTGVHYRVGDPSRLHGYYVPKISIKEGVERAINAVRVS